MRPTGCCCKEVTARIKRLESESALSRQSFPSKQYDAYSAYDAFSAILGEADSLRWYPVSTVQRPLGQTCDTATGHPWIPVGGSVC